MPRYPSRPWWHPLAQQASNPHGYTWMAFLIPLWLLYPWRFKIARYYERQRDSPGSGARQQAVRYYKHLECMLKREILFKQPMINDEQPFARHLQSVTQTSFMIGNVDSELTYWESHQKDLFRAAKLTEELRDLKKKQQAAAA